MEQRQQVCSPRTVLCLENHLRRLRGLGQSISHEAVVFWRHYRRVKVAQGSIFSSRESPLLERNMGSVCYRLKATQLRVGM